MNALALQALMKCLGWTLLHFVWQGLAIGTVFFCILRMLPKVAAGKRYSAGCLALLMLAVAPVTTFYFLNAQSRPVVSAQTENEVPIPQKAQLDKSISQSAPVVGAGQRMVNFDFRRRFNDSLSFIVGAWLGGVLICSARLLAGWFQVRRLTRKATSTMDELWHEKLLILSRRIGLRRTIRLLQSALVEVPTVIGWLRPVILLPAGCLTGLSPAQLESILAHELAHIQRHDYLVNLLQNLMETFLFYHPVVWWVSRVVREEREHCCDDLAVKSCGNRVGYVRALATLEELRLAPAQLQLSAGGAPLLKRIRRLAGQNQPVGRPQAWPVAGMLPLVMVLVSGFFVMTHGRRAEARDGMNLETNLISSVTHSTQTASNDRQPGTAITITPDSNSVSRLVVGTNATLTPNSILLAKLASIVSGEIKYDRMPLDSVITNLTEISRAADPNHVGIHFMFAGTAADGPWMNPTKVTINPGIHGASMSDILDAVVHNADHPIFYTIDDFIIFIHQGERVPKLETRTFHLTTNSFGDHFDRSKTLELLGLNWDTNNPANLGKGLVWNNHKGLLFIRTTPDELDTADIHLQQLTSSNLISDGIGSSSNAVKINPAYFGSRGLNAVSLSRSNVVRKLNLPVAGEIKYDRVSLPEVIKDLAERSRAASSDHSGINFMIERQPLSNPAWLPTSAPDEIVPIETINVTLDLGRQNATFGEILNAVMRNANHPLHYSILEFAVVISQGNPPLKLEERTYSVPKSLFGTNASPEDMRAILGLDWDTNNPANVGKAIVLNQRRALLFLRTTQEELDSVGDRLQRLIDSRAELNLKVKIVELDYANGQKWIGADWPMPARANYSMIKTLDPKQFATHIGQLQEISGAQILNCPEITTDNGKQCQFQLQSSDNTNAPLEILDVIPRAGWDGDSVTTTIVWSAIRGFVPAQNSGASYVGDFQEDGKNGNVAPIPRANYVASIAPDLLKSSSLTVNVTDGSTVMLGGLMSPSSNEPLKMQFVFVTPTLINPDGTRFNPK